MHSTYPGSYVESTPATSTINCWGRLIKLLRFTSCSLSLTLIMVTRVL